MIPNIQIEENYEPQIIYGKQTQIIQEIYNYTLLNNSASSILLIEGKAGTGKSYLIKSLIYNFANKYNEILILQFSDKKGENASLLCKFILFLSFGNLYSLSKEAFLELIENSINLPHEIYIDLLEGTLNQITALDVIGRISDLDSDYSLIATNLLLKREVSYIFADDFHKLSTDYSRICQVLLAEITEKSHGLILVLGYRPNEFRNSKFEDYINSKYDKKWQLSYLSNYDIEGSFDKNFNSETKDIARLFPKPINILHLNLLIRKLIEKSIIEAPQEKQVSIFENCYKETNIQNSRFIKNKIQNCQHKDLLYIIYKIESGITIELLKTFFGEDCNEKIENLKNESLIKLENNFLKPFHDVYLYGFLDINFDKKFDGLLISFLENTIETDIGDSLLESNILATLIITSNKLSDDYKNSIRKYCFNYFRTSKYTASRILSKALLPDLDLKDLIEYSNEDLEILYIYAQSIKYSLTHEGANKYLAMICDIGKIKSLDSVSMGYVYEAHSEILNNAIWLIDKNNSFRQINYLENLLLGKISENDSENKINGYLNLLNRKMLYSAVFSDRQDYNKLYQYAISESKRLNRNDYIGYAMMDHAKNIINNDFKDALELLENVYLVFCIGNSYLKRKYDCKSEIVFIKAILNLESFDELYKIQRKVYVGGYLHAYAKATLKVLALELYQNYDVESIELRLKQLFIQYPDMKNEHRLNAFAFHIWSAIYYKKKDYSMQYHFAKKYISAISKMSNDYKIVANHNSEELAGDEFAWFQNNTEVNKNYFWLELRLW